MEKLKSFLITRLILLFAAVMAAEAGARFLVQRVLLPYAGAIAHYTGDMRILSISDMLRIMADLLMGHGQQVVINVLGRSAVIFILLLAHLRVQKKQRHWNQNGSVLRIIRLS